MKILIEFKEFALRGNFVDICVGLLIGAGLTPVASSFIKDVVMPPIGLVLGGTDFSQLFLVIQEGQPLSPYATREAALAAGAVTINYGLFINTLLSFLVTMWFAFLAVKGINALRHRSLQNKAIVEEATTKICPHCCSVVAVKASKCAHCTSALS